MSVKTFVQNALVEFRIVIVALCLLTLPLKAQDVSADANTLFVEAMKSYREALDTDGDARAGGMLRSLQLFGRVTGEFPDHRLAGLIEGRAIPNLDLTHLVPEGWTTGKQSVARDLLTVYENDLPTLRDVADGAIYALLSAATYDGEDGQKAKAQARKLGWTEVDIPPAKAFLVGQAKASLFTKNGQAVLAFRGTTGGRDWLTNAGTIVPVPLVAEQVIDAVALAVVLAEDYPNLILTGHSLGGRLAQASRRVLDRPAYVFNSAPVGLPELTVLGVANLIDAPSAPLKRFRHPQDQLSGVFPANDLEVANIFEAPGILTANPFNDITAAYFHDIDVLYRAMNAVRLAHENGWLSAVLIGLPVDEDSPPGATQPPQKPAQWGPGIVPPKTVSLGYRPCGDRSDIAACLAEKGLPPEAVAFSMAVAGDMLGEVFATEFQETGAIDVAHVIFQGASPVQWPVLINGAAGEIAIDGTRDLSAAFQDPTSQKMLRRYPNAFARDAWIQAHRLLDDGTQRFVLVESVVDGCRGCAILGSATTYLEIGPATGGVLKRRPIGLLIGDPSDSVDLTATVLRRRADSLQAGLNSLGYDAGEMDGFPGPQTRTALMAFQADRCLSITGQPDLATARALLGATGFDALCADRAVPPGITANTPLLSGRYVTDLRQCSLDPMPWDLLWEQVLIDGPRMILGHENPCTTRRTDIRNGMTLFRGTCTWADQVKEASWRLDVLSNSAFVYHSQTNTFGGLEPATYQLCDAGMGSDIETADEDFEPATLGTLSPSEVLLPEAPLRTGIYVNDPAICQTPGVTPEIFDRLIYIGEKVYERLDTSCSVRHAATRDGITTIQAWCNAEGEVTDARWSWRIPSNERFIQSSSLSGPSWSHCAPTTPLGRAHAEQLGGSGETRSGPVEASSPPEVTGRARVEDCARIANRDIRLECFDAAFRHRPETRAETAETVRAPRPSDAQMTDLAAQLRSRFQSVSVNLPLCTMTFIENRALEVYNPGSFADGGGWAGLMDTTRGTVRPDQIKRIGTRTTSYTVPLGQLDFNKTGAAADQRFVIAVQGGVPIRATSVEKKHGTTQTLFRDRPARDYSVRLSDGRSGALPDVYKALALLKAFDAYCKDRRVVQ